MSKNRQGMNRTLDQHQPENPTTPHPDRCKNPPAPEFNSYFPARIMGYISYSDEDDTG